MRLLLDENFPVQLARRLRSAGHAVEHLVESDQRGLPDSAIRVRLDEDGDLLFLTQDTDFEDVSASMRARVIISRVPQSLPITVRVDIWMAALATFLAQPPPGRLFELLASGEMVPIDVRG